MYASHESMCLSYISVNCMIPPVGAIHEIRSNPSGGNSRWPTSCAESGLETSGHCGGLRLEGVVLLCL